MEEGCVAEDDQVSTGGDCDDLEPEVSPGAVETCNEVDDNCDGDVDEDLGDPWYADVDNDDYGDPDAVIVACDQPLGTTGDATDCDDRDARVNPSAAPTTTPTATPARPGWCSVPCPARAT